MNLIKTTSAVNPKQILMFTDPQVSVSVVVGNTGLTAGSDGKKVLKAGTPLAGDLTARNTAFKKATTTAGGSGAASTSDAVGILLHDVDVTEDSNNGTLLIFGFVNLDKLDETTAALIDYATKTALSGKITFLK